MATKHFDQRRALLRTGLAGGALGLTGWAGPALAQQAYPNHPIKLFAPSTAGGTMDLTARLMAQYLGPVLGQPVVVENKVGAAGLIAMQQLVRMPADGYTFAWVGNGLMTVSPFLSKNPGYDVKTLVTVGQATAGSFALWAGVDLPFRDLKGLVAYAKANPGKLNFGSSGTYSSLHLLGEVFKIEAGFEAEHVAFKGAADAANAIMGGNIQYVFDALSTNLPLARAGKLRALAVTGPRRVSTLPDVPTMAELGYPNMTTELFYGIVAAPGTPDAVVAKVSEAMKVALADPLLRESFAKAGHEARPTGPQEFRALVDKEGGRFQALFKAKGIQPTD